MGGEIEEGGWVGGWITVRVVGGASEEKDSLRRGGRVGGYVGGWVGGRTVRVVGGASEEKESFKRARSSLNSGAVRRMRLRVCFGVGGWVGGWLSYVCMIGR